MRELGNRYLVLIEKKNNFKLIQINKECGGLTLFVAELLLENLPRKSKLNHYDSTKLANGQCSNAADYQSLI